MKCPHCQADLPEEARYCPHCGRAVGLAARIDIDQRVEQNLGNVIGVKTNVIQGDVYGGDIYQVQFYALTLDSRRSGGTRFLEEYTSPYKFLAPYGLKDRALFKGRTFEVEQALRKIGEGRLLVLYGPPGVGKTSLVAAGIIPELIENGALAVHIRDYTQPLGRTLRQALAASREQFPLELPEDADLPAVVQAIQAAAEGTLVLFLDQFERALRPEQPAELRGRIMQEISQSLNAVPAEFLRLVVVVPDDPTLRLADFQEALPEAFTAFLEVHPLSRKQAVKAIEEPLREPDKPPRFPVYFEEGLVGDDLVLDLDNLTDDMPNCIYPPYLQIVCYRLYEMGLELNPPVITRKIYLNRLRGAGGILARYLNETLEEQLADEGELARRLLVTLLAPGQGEWVEMESLNISGVAPERVRDVLSRLEGATFLIRKRVDGRLSYAVANHVVEREVLAMAGPDAELAREAGRELDRIYAGWKAEEELATRSQVRRLAEHGRHLAPWPVKRLLMLRSAAAHRAPLGYWVDWLRYDLGQSYLKHVSGMQAEALPESITGEQVQEGKRILQMFDKSGAEISIPEGKGYCRLAWAAVNARDPSARQAAALSLLAIDFRLAKDRVDWALKDGPKGLSRLARQAGAYGVLAEVEPEFERLNAEQPPLRRAAIWGWRVWQRIAADWDRLFLLTLSAALAAGLFSGLWRVVAALLNGRVPGANATPDAVFGALLGGALVFGKLLADHVLLRPVGAPPAAEDRAGPRLAWLLGGLFFGLMHAFITLSLGSLNVSGAGLIVVMGFAAGLALSAALAAHPLERLLQARNRALRVLAAGLSFAAIHGVFLLAGQFNRTLAVVWPGGFYRAGDLSLWRALGLVPAGEIPSFAFPNVLATVDAVMVGFALALGVLAGLRLAVPVLERWRRSEV